MPDAVYSNHIEVRSAFYDFTLTFSRVSEIKQDDQGKIEPVVELMARVQLSPQHAKMFLGALASNVAKYEERFGKIADPPAELIESSK